MGVLHAIVNGTCDALDLSACVNALHIRMAELNAVSWWEYVPSPSNIADGGSRVGVDCPSARAMGIPLKIVQLPNFPASFPRVRAVDWEVWWS